MFPSQKSDLYSKKVTIIGLGCSSATQNPSGMVEVLDLMPSPYLYPFLLSVSVATQPQCRDGRLLGEGNWKK